MRKLTISEINAIELTEKEQKSNDAFVILTKAIKFYNEGWEPTREDHGYLVYSRKLRIGSHCGVGYADSIGAFSDSSADYGARLAIRDLALCKFIAENYEQEYKDLWMED